MTNPNNRIKKLFDAVTLQAVLSDLSHLVSLERLGARYISRVIWRAPIQEQRIALTFDDGPNTMNTPALLEILRKHEIPATFFLVGKHIRDNHHLAKEIVQNGHEIANHTFTHPLMPRLSDEKILQEIAQTDELLRNLNGVVPKFLRPPMGLFSPRVLNIIEEAGYKTVVGDVYPRDPHLPGKEKIRNRVMSRTKNGSILILHDGGNSGNVDRSQTLWAVDKFVPRLQNKGFTFVTLSELLNISPK